MRRAMYKLSFAPSVRDMSSASAELTVEMLLSLYEARTLYLAERQVEGERNVSFDNVVDSKEVEGFDPCRLSLLVELCEKAA